MSMTLGLKSTLNNGNRSRFIVSFLLALPPIIFASVFFEAIAPVNGDRGVHFDGAHVL
ncbi:hypothetical protein C8R47DRAFT_1227607 [Mycena vitilis]|nr:hypothetical protein C8R47DRAFT_1227607 [Mycena vitilis]